MTGQPLAYVEPDVGAGTVVICWHWIVDVAPRLDVSVISHSCVYDVKWQSDGIAQQSFAPSKPRYPPRLQPSGKTALVAGSVGSTSPNCGPKSWKGCAAPG